MQSFLSEECLGSVLMASPKRLCGMYFYIGISWAVNILTQIQAMVTSKLARLSKHKTHFPLQHLHKQTRLSPSVTSFPEGGGAADHTIARTQGTSSGWEGGEYIIAGNDRPPVSLPQSRTRVSGVKVWYLFDASRMVTVGFLAGIPSERQLLVIRKNSNAYINSWRTNMAEEERPPAPPIRLTSTKDMSPASRPLPSAPVDEKKKKTAGFGFFKGNKGDEEKKCKRSSGWETSRSGFKNWKRVGLNPSISQVMALFSRLQEKPKAWNFIPDTVRAYSARWVRSCYRRIHGKFSRSGAFEAISDVLSSVVNVMCRMVPVFDVPPFLGKNPWTPVRERRTDLSDVGIYMEISSDSVTGATPHSKIRTAYLHICLLDALASRNTLYIWADQRSTLLSTKIWIC